MQAVTEIVDCAPPEFVVEFPTKPITYAYTTTPAAIAIKIRSSVAIIGEMALLSFVLTERILRFTLKLPRQALFR